MSSTPSTLGKRKVEEREEQRDHTDSKKPRLRWSPELHGKFVDAFNQLNGVKNAIPSKILKLMKVPGLTHGQVSSHLQKYRLHLNRIGGVSSHQENQNNSFMTTGRDASFGPLSTLNGSELQALPATAQSRVHRLAAGLIPHMMVSNTTRFRDGIGHHWQQSQQQSQVSVLHGIPTGIQQQQLPMSIQQQIAADVQAGQCSFHNSGMMMPLGVQQPSLRGLPPMLPFSQSSYSQPILQTCYNSGAIQHSSSSVAFENFQQELPVNSFPQASPPTLLAPDWKATSSYMEYDNNFEAGFTSLNYDDMFTDDMFTNGQGDWDLPRFTVLDTLQDSEESAVYLSPAEAYSSSSMSRNNTTVAANHQQPPPGMVLHHQVDVADEGGGSELSDDEYLMRLLSI